MPSVSGAQHRFMAKAMNDADFARAHGIAPSVAAEFVHADKGAPWQHRAAGGILSGRMNPMQSVTMDAGAGVGAQNPMQQQAYGRFQDMPSEKLRELAVRTPPGSPQGQLLQRALGSRMMHPQSDPGAAPQQAPQPGGGVVPYSPPPAQPAGAVPFMNAPTMPASPNVMAFRNAPAMPARGMPTAARGGEIARRDGGGPLGMSLSMASPWWERSEERGMGSGMLRGSTFGRADHVTTAVPGGGYVVPADVVAGLGEGNSLAGASVMDRMLRSGPFGTPMPRIGRGSGPPRAPAAPRTRFKSGGAPEVPGQVPVKLSDGEYFIAPHHVRRIGGGDLKRGHAILDAWVVNERKEHIKKLKNLPGPVKAAA